MTRPRLGSPTQDGVGPAMTEREASDIWILPAAAIVAAITALRIVLLALSPSDLHALESQLWVLARAPAEAPSPLAVWLVRALGWAGDAPWILRLPAPVLHGVAAMVLGSVAERLFGPRMALATPFSDRLILSQTSPEGPRKRRPVMR